MSEQFLDRPNIVAILKQVRGKGMPKGMATDAFYQPGSENGFPYGSLKQGFMHRMSPFRSDLHRTCRGENGRERPQTDEQMQDENLSIFMTLNPASVNDFNFSPLLNPTHKTLQ